LMVDDEPLILDGFKRQLRNKVDLTTAGSGREGLEIISRTDPFALVVSDMRMPEMNGAAFLEKVRAASPDAVRMILSGQAELEATIAAVNRGQIFRFLTKPLSGDDLVNAIEAGLEQYRLVTAQRELLENTLRGAVKVLTEILSLTNPLAQQRANRIASYAREIAKSLGVPCDWQLELACMLSQIGCITLPEELLSRVNAGQTLSAEEQQLYVSHPTLAGKLLAGIPRLEGVVALVQRQRDDRFGQSVLGAPATWPPLIASAVVLRAAVEFDDVLGSGKDSNAAACNLVALFPKQPVPQWNALLHIEPVRADAEMQAVKVPQLLPGMVLDEDLVNTSGKLLASKGQEFTLPLILRLQSIYESINVKEPFRVRIPPSGAS
jgi:CheY-like chemotaxis protein